jgi:hypothetical protein
MSPARETPPQPNIGLKTPSENVKCLCVAALAQDPAPSTVPASMQLPAPKQASQTARACAELLATIGVCWQNWLLPVGQTTTEDVTL